MKVFDLVKVGMISRYENMMSKYEDAVGDAKIRSLLTKCICKANKDVYEIDYARLIMKSMGLITQG